MRLFFGKGSKLRNVWWILIFFLILSSLLFPLIILADRFSFQITLVHQVIIIAIVSVVCQLLRRKPISELTGILGLTWLRQLFFGLMLGSLLMVFPVLILSIFGYVRWEINAFSFSEIGLGFTTLLMAAVAEELLFRGFLFQRLIQAFGNWPAQLIIAIMFLLTHINNPNMTGVLKWLAGINIFIASIMFGIAYIKTASLAMPLGLHFMANFMQGVVLGFGVSGDKSSSIFKPVFENAPVWLSGGDFGIEASFLGLFFVVMMTVYMHLKTLKSI